MRVSANELFIASYVIMHYIYVITNTLNGKRYVGLTKSPRNRWRTHQRIASAATSTKYLIHVAIEKYGADVFTFEIVQTHEDRKLAFSAEAELIAELQTFGANGYNLNSGGNENLTISDRTKALISAANKRRYADPEERRKHSEACKKRKVSEVTRRKLSATQTGRSRTQATKDKISTSKLGKKLNISPEVQARLTEGRKKKKLTQEHKDKLRQANFNRRGKPLSTEHRASISRSLRKKKLETDLVDLEKEKEKEENEL